MDRQSYCYNRFRLVPLIGISLLVIISIYLTKSSWTWSEKNSWTYFRLITMSCLTSKECLDFNVTYSFNGSVVFHGTRNTNYLGKKIFQLSIDRIMAIRKFIDEFCFTSDFEGNNLIVQMEYSLHEMKVYRWTNQSIDYQRLMSLLMIEKLVSFKRRSILWEMAHVLAMIQLREQKFKRTIDVHWMNVENDIPRRYVRSTVELISTDDILTRNFDENLCFSLQEETTNFDLVDACLATNEIIGENQFYLLPDESKWILNANEPMTTTSSHDAVLSHSSGIATSPTASDIASTSASTTESLTTYSLNDDATRAVSKVEAEEQSLLGINDPRIIEAQEKIDQLPLGPSKATLQGRLDVVKARLYVSTAATVTADTSKAPTTISSLDEATHTTSNAALGTSEEVRQTTVGVSDTTAATTASATHSLTEETEQTTISSTLSHLTSETLTSTIAEAESGTNIWTTELFTSSSPLSDIDTFTSTTTIENDISTQSMNDDNVDNGER